MCFVICIILDACKLTFENVDDDTIKSSILSWLDAANTRLKKKERFTLLSYFISVENRWELISERYKIIDMFKHDRFTGEPYKNCKIFTLYNTL